METINVQAFEAIASEAYKITQTRKQLEIREKQLMEQLKAVTMNNEFKHGSFSLRRVTRPGNVDYSAIPMFKSFDFAPFRKADIVYFKLEFVDQDIEKAINELIS